MARDILIRATLRPQEPAHKHLDDGDRSHRQPASTTAALTWLMRIIAIDANRFDQLTRTLFTTGTRRGALAALLAGTLGLLGLPETAAGRGKQRHQQDRTRQENQREAHRRGHDAKTTAKKRRQASAEGPCGDGGAKANTCTKAKDCCTRFCDEKKGRCRCKKLGQTCTEDRNCCATLGQPMTCQSGACQTVSPPVPPPPACSPPCPACQTCRDAVCMLAAGQACGTATCVAGVATPQGTCTAGGTCQPGTPVSCAPYVQCAGSVCATTCDTNGDCLPDFFCNSAHQCVGKQANGASCANGGQCQSGNCVDGVCCNTACDGECEACNLSGSVGTCSDTPSGTSCTCGTCDATATCVPDPGSTDCCGTNGRCLDEECIDAYATIPLCGGRCNCSGAGCSPVDTGQLGPTSCSSTGFAPCSDCLRCDFETNCDAGEFARIPDGPQGTSYYCTCTPPDVPDGTCPPGTEEFCNSGGCWNICDDP